MSEPNVSNLRGVVVDEGIQFTLVELSRVCRAEIAQLVVLVDEGVLTPSGDDPQRWRFGGNTLKRARLALRLTQDLELNVSGTALVLDLLDQIEQLRSRLHRLGLY